MTNKPALLNFKNISPNLRDLAYDPGNHLSIPFLNEFDPGSAAPALTSGEVVIAISDSLDFLASKELGLPKEYILPDEGIHIWGDSFVIPANSHNKIYG
jgi:spermidine/putrescine-binding protein